MITLSTLKDSTRFHKRTKRVGRGIGSGVGKTCGRGQKGAGARSGYKRRFGYEGGQFRTFMKIPQRGFSQARFRKPYHVINLFQINEMFDEGETVNLQTLAERGYLSGRTYGIKILGTGEITKKLSIEAHAFSDCAIEKLNTAKVSFTLLTADLVTSEQISSSEDSEQ
jgi:large subunit ribosomal protein L15